MEIRILFGFQGRVSRVTYALTGILGVLLKHNLDRLLAYKLLHHSWGVSNYLSPLGILSGPHILASQEKQFLLALGVTAVPFIWVGIAMTVKRLRDAGLPTRLVVLFFAPILNLFFFLLLCALPSRKAMNNTKGREVGILASVLPKSQFAIGVFSAIAGALAGSALCWVSIAVFGTYGWTLFLGIPFFMGFLAVWLYCYQSFRAFSECGLVGTSTVVLTGLVILSFAIDGLFCIIMAAPIAIAMALLGAYVAYVIQGVRSAEAQSGAVLSLFLAVPLMGSAEFLTPLPTPEFKTHTSIEISAPPQIVWQHIISFPHIDEPLNPIFRLGISFPLEAQITGTGLTADRQCIFSSGAFREPILAWEEGKHFAFGVSEEPPLMKEWSPYANIHVRHLDDHDFKPQRADFYLTALPNGRTRLDGWTTYQNRMWPGAYWRLWTDT